MDRLLDARFDGRPLPFTEQVHFMLRLEVPMPQLVITPLRLPASVVNATEVSIIAWGKGRDMECSGTALRRQTAGSRAGHWRVKAAHTCSQRETRTDQQ